MTDFLGLTIRNYLLVGLVHPQKASAILIALLLLGLLLVRMQLQSKFTILLPQLQIRTVLIQMQNLIAITYFQHLLTFSHSLNGLLL